MSNKRDNPSNNSKSGGPDSVFASNQEADISGSNQSLPLREAFQHFIPRKYLLNQNEGVSEAPAVAVEIQQVDYNEESQTARHDGKGDDTKINYNPAQITEIISSSTATIKKLIEVNETLKEQAFEAISSFEEQLKNEKSYSVHLRRELEDTRAGYQKDTEQNSAKIKELEQLVGALSEKLKQTMGQLDNAVKWFENINSQINSELLEAIDKAELIVKDRKA